MFRKKMHCYYWPTVGRVSCILILEEGIRTFCHNLVLIKSGISPCEWPHAWCHTVDAFGVSTYFWEDVGENNGSAECESWNTLRSTSPGEWSHDWLWLLQTRKCQSHKRRRSSHSAWQLDVLTGLYLSTKLSLGIRTTRQTVVHWEQWSSWL